MSIITEKELKDGIKQHKFKNIYLLYGDEKYLITTYTNMLKKAILGDEYLDFNYQQFSNKDTVDEIYDAVVALPVMSEIKLILVKDMDFSILSQNDTQKLIEMCENIPETSVIIFSQVTINVSMKKTTNAKNILSMISKYGFVLELKKKQAYALSAQLVLWAKKRGCELSLKNADKIVEYSNLELMELTKELEKLCSYCQNREITKKDIDLVMSKTLTANVFDLSKMMCSRNYDKAYRQLDLLLYNKEEPIMIVAVLATAFIDMYRVKAVENDNKNVNVLLSSFDYKNKEFRIRNAKRNMENLSLKQLGDIIKSILETDVKLKSAKCDKEVLLQTLIARIILITNKKESTM